VKVVIIIKHAQPPSSSSTTTTTPTPTPTTTHLRSAATAAAKGSGTPHDDDEYDVTNCSSMLLLTAMVGGTASPAHATVNTPPP